MGSGFDAFISYRHGDGAAAQGVAKLLRAFNQRVFIDVDIAAGDEWAPEIWEALSQTRVLIVVWSRSAAKSAFVRREWSSAPKGCSVFALRLDGEPLPDDLGEFNAINGLDVAGRLLARSVELMQRERLSPSRAQEKLLTELEQDGVVLEAKQKQALAAFLPIVAGNTIWGLAPWAAVGAVVAPALLVAGSVYLIVTRPADSMLHSETSPSKSSINANLPGIKEPDVPAVVPACPAVAPCPVLSSAASTTPPPQAPSRACVKEREELQHCAAERASCSKELEKSRTLLGETKTLLGTCERTATGLKAVEAKAVDCGAKLERCVELLRRTKPTSNTGATVLNPDSAGALLNAVPQTAAPATVTPKPNSTAVPQSNDVLF